METQQILYNIIKKYNFFDVKMSLVETNTLDKIKQDILKSFLIYLEKEIETKGFINVGDIKIIKRDYGILFKYGVIEEIFM